MTFVTQLKRAALAGLVAATATLGLTAPALAWWEDGFAYRTKINLNAQAAGLTGEVARAPVLVRLHQGNFNFADVKPDASDLRFVAGDDRTPLAFHIEKWSLDEQQALIWVDVSGLKPGVAAAIYAYYGNPEAKPGQAAAATFAPEYRLVWHFDGSGAPRDATANALHGDAEAVRTSAGLIGQGVRLDGSAPLALPAAALGEGPFSLSLWVKAEGAAGTLLAMPGRLSLALSGGTLVLQAGTTRTAGPALPAGSWTHVAVSYDGQATRLFVNGAPAGEAAGALPAATGPAVLGQGFSGEIDELRAAEAALPHAVFQLAVAGEGQSPRLLAFDPAEQLDSGGHGYMSILFGALTLDAWIVIAILAVMFAIAVWVMISKGQLLARTSAANDRFLAAYQQAMAEHNPHDGLNDARLNQAGLDATLGRLFHIGRRELALRLADARRTGTAHALAPQSVAAIRAALDAGQARESQRLNRWMVLLTIAISGGPFLGLLGTVIGVMITFAGVAAAGDVNINAIAPGIAAALLATVAGLGVAIPALFGYNYLLSRIEEIDTDNRIFIDELEKRIAETYRGASNALAAE